MCCICTCHTWLVPTPGGKRVTNYVSRTRTIRECRQLCYMCTYKTGLAHTSVGKRVTNYVYGTRTIIQCRQLCYICTCKTWLSHTYVGKWVTNYVYGTWTIRECRQLCYIWVTKYVCKPRTMYRSCTLLKSVPAESAGSCAAYAHAKHNSLMHQLENESRTMYMGHGLQESVAERDFYTDTPHARWTCNHSYAHAKHGRVQTSVGKWVTNYVFEAWTIRKCGWGRYTHRYSKLQIEWHRILRLFLNFCQSTSIPPMGFTISTM